MSKYSHQKVTRGKYETSQSILLDWMREENGAGEKRRVLEFGSSSGYMTRALKESCDCEVYIVEFDHEDFLKAIQFARDGILGDIMKFEWLEKWRDIQFDAIIFADVLEHLYDPSAVLSATKQLLKPDGVVLLSLPNIGHDDVLRNLFMNKFFYTRTGLLDNTHIRFFAYHNLAEFAEKNGFSIIEEKFIRFARGMTEQYDATWREYNPIDDIIDQRQGGDIYQFVLKLATIEYAARHGIQYTRTVGGNLITSKWYYDFGEGVSEQNSQEIVSSTDSRGHITQIFAVPAGCKALRWDPEEQPCIVREVVVTSGNGTPLSCAPMNGLVYDENSVFFNHTDPQFLITLPEVVTAGLAIHLNALVRVLPPNSSDHEFAKIYNKLTWVNDENHQLREENQRLTAENQRLTAENAMLSSRWKNIAKRLLLQKLAPPTPPLSGNTVPPAPANLQALSQTPNGQNELIKTMWTPAKDFGLFVPYRQHNFAAGSGDVKLIAYYLPQFHSFPENDIWWEKGFTEWTNVTKTLPWFAGHYQPRLPYDLGFYDLSDINVTRRQVELAKNYGLHGFCVYYYWFNGKRLMEKPLDHFLDPSVDFPFCICWANENWTRRWDGNEMDILIEQKHSDEDDLRCIADMARYLRDRRYIRIDGKPVVIIYRGNLLPNVERTITIWKKYCLENGIGDILVAGCLTRNITDPMALGFDMGIEFPPHRMHQVRGENRQHEIFPELTYRYHDMGKFIDTIDTLVKGEKNILKAVFTNWDNTPRRRDFPNMWHLSPEQYQIWLKKAIAVTCETQEPGKRLVFINAWNEWAEAAHLEPDQRYGYAYLEATAQALEGKEAGSADKPAASAVKAVPPSLQSGVIIPAVFLHIQKTAGTSLVKMARTHYGREHCLDHGDYIGKSAESLFDVPFVSGHFGYSWAEKLIQSRKSFTFLRDPQERVLSFYHFCRFSRPADEFPIYALAQQHSFLEFLKLGFDSLEVCPYIWNCQVWNLSRGFGDPDGCSPMDFSPESLLEEAIVHAHNFDFIGLVENFQQDVWVIADMLEWRVPESHRNIHANHTMRSQSVRDLSGEEKELLAELTKLDTRLYNYVKSELRRDLV